MTEQERSDAESTPSRDRPRRARSTVRRAAIEVLLSCEDGRAFVDEALAARIDEFEPRDRHLLQEICYGAMRHVSTLDRLLKLYLRVPIAKQRPMMRWTLRVGAYQLVYLGRVPAHAAVNQTLEALKRLEGVQRRDVGFANAVLHKLSADILRKTSTPPEDELDPTVLPIREGWCWFQRPILPLYRLDALEHLSVRHSHPRWMVTRWVERFGEEETRKLLAANNHVPPVTVRVTRRAESRDAVLAELAAAGFDVEPAKRDDTLFLRGGGAPSLADAIREGRAQVQDLTAIEIGEVLSPPSNARVLDLCASPGGKAVQLLERLDEGSRFLAADRSEEKLTPVRENLAKTGRDGFRTIVLPEDPTHIDLGERFTHILVDAPCSNTGVLARRPDARWRLRPADIESLAAIQSALLEAAYRHLEPGGRLVYATCSIEPEENEERIAALMSAHADLHEIESKAFLPHRSAGDGGFYSLMRKTV